MVDKLKILAEAGKRGVLPPEKKAVYDEAVKRGIIGNTLDTVTGAPANVRAAMGTGDPNDQLKTLRKYYPDAEFHGKSVVTGNTSDNFIFTNPKTGRLTLANPKGLDIGDIAEYGGEISEAAGGVVGGAVGSLSPDPVTTYAGIGLGAGIGREVWDLSQQALAGREDSRGLGEHLTDSTATVVLNAAAPKVFDSATTAAKEAGRSIIHPVKNRIAQANAPQILDDFTRANVTPSSGAVSGNRAIQWAEDGLTRLPGSARVMQTHTAKIETDIAEYALNIAEKFGPVRSLEGAGSVIKEGAGKAVSRFKDRSNDLYNKLSTYFAEEERIPIQNTLNFLKNKIDDYRADPAIGEKFNREIIDYYKRLNASGDGTLSFRALKRIRSDVGAKIGDAIHAVDDLNSAQTKGFYKAIIGDIDRAAIGKGKDANKAAQIAKRYYRYNSKRNIPALEKILKAKDDETAFKLATSGMKDGGSQLRKMRVNLKPEEWDAVAGSVLGRMGKAKAGAQNIEGDIFSVSTFLTEWNKLAPESKNVLFGSTRYKSLKPQLDRLLRIAGSLKDTNIMSNPSGTGQSLNFTMLMAGLGGAGASLATGDVGTGAKSAVGIAATTILVPSLMAKKLITNPKFVKWLAGAARVSATNPGNLPSHVARLGVIATGEPEIKEEVYQYLQQIQDIGMIQEK